MECAHQRALAPTGDRLVAKNEDDDRLVAINIDATAPPPPPQRAIRPLDTKPPAPTPNRDLSFVLIPINRPPPIPTHASLGDCAIMGIVMGLGNSINTDERTFRVVGPAFSGPNQKLSTLRLGGGVVLARGRSMHLIAPPESSGGWLASLCRSSSGRRH